jgi:Animal haem peroxidase
MSHHGWIPVIDPLSLTPSGLKAPFGRLFPAASHTYNSHAVSLLTGALGPVHRLNTTVAKPTIPTGFTFLGQFIDHDLTEFRVIGEAFALIPQNPVLGQRQLVLEDRRLEGQFPTTTNGRIPKLDLDSVYGLLGVAQPDLYTDDGLFRLEKDSKGVAFDILRDEPGKVAKFRDGRLIADPRNDENKIVVQLQVLFERLHNKIHEGAGGTTEDRRPAGSVFLATKETVLQVYHNIVLHDYLPRIVRLDQMKQVVKALDEEKTFYQRMNKRNRQALVALGFSEEEVSDTVAMPVEFAHAAFRLGHSQLRTAYTLNADHTFPLFATQGGGEDLRGKQPILPKFRIDWSFFFPGGAKDPIQGEPIDGTLPEAVFRLPPPTVSEPPLSLAERNVRRGIDFGLPSGQEVASLLTEVYGPIQSTTFEQLFPSDLQAKYSEILEADPSLAWRTPLWYYILREAEFLEQGAPLGPVGGFIVAETILGSLAETQGVGLEKLKKEIGKVAAAPDSRRTASRAKPADIRTMAQLLSFLNS